MPLALAVTIIPFEQPRFGLADHRARPVRSKVAVRSGQKRGLMDRLIGHYGPYCDYCLARWEAATLFDYGVVLVMIITGGWLTSRLQSR